MENEGLETAIIDTNENDSLKNMSTLTDKLDDFRFLWIWQRVMVFFELEPNHKVLFDNLLIENDCYILKKMIDYFNADLFNEYDLEKKVIYFYKTYRKEIIQEEVPVWEEIPAVTPYSNKGRSQRLTKSAPGKVEKVEDDKNKKKKKKKAKRDSKSEENSTISSNIFTGVSATNVNIDLNNDEDEEISIQGEDDEIADEQSSLQQSKLQSKSSFLLPPPPGEENKYILTKKIVDKEVELPALHIIFGHIRRENSEENKNSNFLYFLRLTDEPVPQFRSADDCNEKMADYLSIGSLNGNLKETLTNMLIYFVKPLIEKRQDEIFPISNQHSSKIRDSNKNEMTDSLDSEDSQSDESTLENSIQRSHMEHCKSELFKNLDKLTDCLQWSLKQIEGNDLLQLPKLSNINAMNLIDMSKLDENQIKELEEIIMIWGKHIEKVLDTYIQKTPEGKGPLAEYHYWQEREKDLSMVVEQLLLPTVRKLSSSNVIDSSVQSAFHRFEMELWKLYSDAKNNNKFLATVLRYFELMAESDDFEAISEIIPSLMEGMRMIWVLSKHYNDEERMTSLLERISWQLCENVKKNLSIKELFSKPLKDILSKTKSAYEMMNIWKTSYIDTRKAIELTEKGVRWEFDQQRLFKKTVYIAKVCNDLNKIASILEDFYNIFGVELKSIVNDPIQIDTIVKKVDELTIPILNSDFNIFTEFNKENWDATMVWFHLEVGSLENEAKSLIDDCFTSLISAEQALQLLLKFKNIKTRQTIQDCLLMKFDVIIYQFSKEMNQIENIFHESKKNPPRLKYHSSTVGAIFWERQLYYRLKRAIEVFGNVPELKESTLKSVIFDQYSKIARQIKEYEQMTFDTWVEKAEPIVKNIINKKILTTITMENAKFADNKPMTVRIRKDSLIPIEKSRSDGSRRKLSSIKNIPNQKSIHFSTSQFEKSTTKSLCFDDKFIKASVNSSRIDEESCPYARMTDDIMVEKQQTFQVNFNYLILDILEEAEKLELLGFDLPISIRNISIQKDHLKADINAVRTMIHEYNELMAKLDGADIKLLIKEIKNIEKHINSGVTRMNWSFLTIEDYSLNCRKLLKNLRSIVSQLNHMKYKLDNVINDDISSYNLCVANVNSNSSESELSLCKQYFLDIQTKRTELIHEMLRSYQSITPLMIRIENLIIGTWTGKSNYMRSFYENYEKKVFAGLIICFSRNLETLNNILNGDQAMFSVDAILSSQEVILQPSPIDITTVILLNVKDLLEKGKLFPRWMYQTCLFCENIKNNEYKLSEFNFFEDIISVQIINDRIREIYETTQKLTSGCWNYIYKWKKYSNVWRLDKTQICRIFAKMNPNLSQYDDKFTFYDTLIEEVEIMAPYYDICSIRINLSPLITNIKQHVHEWKQILGNFLLSHVQRSMKNLEMKIKNFRYEIELIITGLNQFKTVMQSIANIKNMAIQAEVEYNEYQETFRMLKSHNIEYPQEDEEQAYKLQQDWQSVYFSALFREKTLSSTKDCFCEMTKEQISNFLKQCQDFAEYYKKEGPESVGNNLDLGVIKMMECDKLIADLEERQNELMKAEKLFDLPSTDYSIFTQIKNKYEAMKLVYSLYENQRDARDTWSKTLWVDLNPQLLIDGIEIYIGKFQELPQSVKQLPIARSLESTMQTFKNSVPLFIELKNEAMRERHWRELMNKTMQFADIAENKESENNE